MLGNAEALLLSNNEWAVGLNVGAAGSSEIMHTAAQPDIT